MVGLDVHTSFFFLLGHCTGSFYFQDHMRVQQNCPISVCTIQIPASKEKAKDQEKAVKVKGKSSLKETPQQLPDVLLHKSENGNNSTGGVGNSHLAEPA